MMSRRHVTSQIDVIGAKGLQNIPTWAVRERSGVFIPWEISPERNNQGKTENKLEMF